MRVTDQNVPPLIPGGFLRHFGSKIDYPESTLTWTRLNGRVSALTVLPSDHITCRIDECDHEKWMDPRQKAQTIFLETEVTKGKKYQKQSDGDFDPVAILAQTVPCEPEAAASDLCQDVEPRGEHP